MATYNDAYFTPEQASALTNGAFDAYNKALPTSGLFPVVNVNDIRVNWIPNSRRKVTEAKFYAYNTQAPLDTEFANGSAMSMNLLHMQEAHLLNEEQIIVNRGMSADWVRSKLEESFINFGHAFALRLEAARAEALVNAKLDLDENDLKHPYDFRRDTTLNVSLSTKKWNASTSDPVVDVRGWIKTVQKAEGDTPQTLITTRDVIETISTNENLLHHVTNVTTTEPQPIYVDARVRAAFNSVGIKDIILIDELYRKFQRDFGIDLPRKITDYFPENTIMLVPDFTSAVGSTAVGITAEQVTASYGLQNTKGASSYVYDADHGVIGPTALSRMTAMPVLSMANNTFKATVM